LVPNEAVRIGYTLAVTGHSPSHLRLFPCVSERTLRLLAPLMFLGTLYLTTFVCVQGMHSILAVVRRKQHSRPVFSCSSPPSPGNNSQFLGTIRGGKNLLLLSSPAPSHHPTKARRNARFPKAPSSSAPCARFLNRPTSAAGIGHEDNKPYRYTTKSRTILLRPGPEGVETVPEV
jgi:hypothetical protein